MNKKLIFFLGILILLFFFLLFKWRENTPYVIVKDLLREGSLEGKTLKFYPEYLGIIPIGEAILKDEGEIVYEGKKVYLLSATAHTHQFLSKLFKVKAEVKSFVDPFNLYTLLFLQHFEMSNRPKRNKKIIYDQENNIMEFEGVKRVILPHTHDPLSAIFYIRKQEFAVGEVFDLNLNTNQKNYRLLAKVIRKEKFRVRDKTIGIWVLEAEIKRRNKSLRHSSSFTIWFLDNSSKTPILIKAMTNMGLITSRLGKIQ